MKKNEIKWLKEHNMPEPPVCLNCGSPVTWRGPKYGYSRFCSNKCLNESDYRKEKTRETCMKKYGTENAMQSEAVRKN